MKRGYALKERSKGKKNELVKKKENEPQRKDQESVLVQNSTTILLLQRSSICAISDFCHS